MLADSVMAIVAPKKFRMAVLKEQFLEAVLENDNRKLEQVYQAVSNTFDGDDAQIERFFLYRAYALRYGSGPESSIPAFKFLITKHPDSEDARQGLVDTESVIGKK